MQKDPKEKEANSNLFGNALLPNLVSKQSNETK